MLNPTIKIALLLLTFKMLVVVVESSMTKSEILVPGVGTDGSKEIGSERK